MRRLQLTLIVAGDRHCTHRA